MTAREKETVVLEDAPIARERRETDEWTRES
jgi:hypothetical protein